MTEYHLIILFLALVADWYFGEPDLLWSRFPHPVVLFGKAISFLDKRYNLTDDNDDVRYRKGAVGVSLLVLISVLIGFGLNIVAEHLGLFGFLLEVFLVFSLLAQKSLIDHVQAVVDGLSRGGIEGGRKAVGMIVGRDPDLLDRSAICRASIESLSENFSDGVVAPAFWYVVFGLPGILAYKTINTADSMIGYHNSRYEYFGKVAAQMDDLVNWLPARLSAFLIAAGAFFVRGSASMKASFLTAFRDSGLHRSPNAGWPESAMAGAAGFALGGPRIYPGETVQQSYLNASGKRDLEGSDIASAIRFVKAAFFAGLGILGVIALGFI